MAKRGEGETKFGSTYVVPDGTAGRNFRENRERFVEGEDFIEVGPDEIRRDLQGAFPRAHTRKTGIPVTAFRLGMSKSGARAASPRLAL